MNKKYKSNLKGRSPFKIFPILLEWLAKCLGFAKTSKEYHLVMQITHKILTILETRGKRETIRYVKDLRLRYVRFLLSLNPHFQSKEKYWFPKSFKPIITLILTEKSYPLIRLAFSALYISRSFRLQEIDDSFSSIIERPLYKGNPKDLRLEIRYFLKELGVNIKRDLYRVPRQLRFKEFHMTSKTGPNGHALWTSYIDIDSISESTRHNISLVGGQKLFDLMLKFSNLYHKIPQFFDLFSPLTRSRISRRLSVFPDKEGKQREVAIVSYYEQAALLPLHKYLQKRLSGIHQDCTDNQTKLFYELEPTKGSSFHSIDLTAFTDRFPISIIEEIFIVWFGGEYAKAWKEIMIGTPFDYKGRKVTYETGNPMGAYSSWPATTLAHHFFVFLACRKAGMKWKKCPYMMLGDDIVIADDIIAKYYKDILSDWCISYSKQKTHTSKYGFEFAKQFRLHGNNISPFPLGALFDRHNETITSLSVIISEFACKDWKIDIISAVERYYVSVKKWNYPLFKRKRPLINLTISLVLFLQGRTDLDIAFQQYVADRGLELKPWYVQLDSPMWKIKSAETAVKVLLETFKQSRERVINPKSGGSLGELATMMVMHITSLRDGGADCFDLIEAVPFLQVYGRAEERYLELTKASENSSRYVSGYNLYEPTQFRKAFEVVDIPLQDAGFYQRHRDVVINQAFKVSQMLIPLVESEFCISSAE